MTNDSKENLLKILLDDKNEKGINTGGTFQYVGSDWNTGSNSNQKEYHTFNGYNIILMTTGEVKVFDSNNKVLMNKFLYINNKKYLIKSLALDNEGMFYAYAIEENNVTTRKLVYLNNVTEKTTTGEYELVPRKTYELTPMWEAILDEIKTYDTRVYDVYSYNIFKSPIDNRLMFIFGGRVANSNELDLLIVEYSVNFEGSNTWQFRATSMSDYMYLQVQCAYVGWTQNNAEVSLLALNSDGGWSQWAATDGSIWSAKVNFSEGSEITTRRVFEIDKFCGTMLQTEAQMGIQLNLNLAYLPINHVEILDTTVYKKTTRIYRYNGRTFKKIYEHTWGNQDFLNAVLVYPAVVNNQAFFCEITHAEVQEPGRNIYERKLLHIVREQIYEFSMDDKDDTNNTFLISNTGDIYNWYLCGYFGTYLYRTGDYNGPAYFSDESLTSSSSELYTIIENQETGQQVYPIYAKELYDRVIGGNTINSVTQIPYNMLNNTPITKEELLSRTNSVISSDNKDITKNQYEELYINNIDTFKVYDNNNGSTYNQNASIQVAKNIYNGFTDEYKIKKYRINYNDSSYSDYDLEKPTRTNNEATIKIGVYNTGIKNIEIYDDNFTTPFITIDLSSLELNKLYTIIQKIKIE